jgi:hypothetical protein
MRTGGWLGLREDAGGRGDSRDVSLTFLSVAQADRVRYLVRQAFAERGREVTVHVDYVRDDRGGEFGLRNVAAACHNDPRGEVAWPAIVAQHVSTLAEHVDGRLLDGFTADDVRSRVFVKLLPAPTAPVRGDLSYLASTVPGLVDSLVVDFPEAVGWLTAAHVSKFGGKDALRAAGLANLRALPPEQCKHIATADGGAFEMLLGESVYTASRVLVMEDLLEQALEPGAKTTYGVLAAMATRNQIAIHTISGRSIVPSLRLMARFALAGFKDGTGPLSPNVFWWRDGQWTQVTRQGPGDRISVLDNPELDRMIQLLDGR